jgi:hypothetical protein
VHDVRYPRKGEAIVPRLLRPLVLDYRPVPRADRDVEMLAQVDLGPGAWTRLSPATCERLAMLVVDRIQTRVHMLPDIARNHRLPDPRVALSLPIERRTAGTIRRALRGAAPGPWTVDRYLKLRRFGGRALVDLLAAIEAHEGAIAETMVEGPADADAPQGALASQRAFDDALRLIARRLPMSEDQACTELVREGLITGSSDLAQLPKLAVRLGRSVPFRTIEVGGSRMLVRLSEVTTARATYRIALRAVQGWGTATTRAVAGRLRLAAHVVVAANFVEQLLIGIDAFRWIDRREGWFWFAERRNPLVDDLRRVFSVATRVPFARLWAALFRRRQGPAPSPEAIAELCAAVPDARIGDGVVTVDRPFDRAVHLGGTENRVARLLETAPAGLSGPEIRARTRALGLPWSSVWRLLQYSPVFEVSAGGLYRLVGAWD